MTKTVSKIPRRLFKHVVALARGEEIAISSHGAGVWRVTKYSLAVGYIILETGSHNDACAVYNAINAVTHIARELERC